MDTLILILKRDTLGIREVKLYYFVLKWAQSQCNKNNYLPINRENQQHVLGEAIKYIRFPLMSKEEFALAMNENESRVIDNESIIDLFINLTLMNSNNNANSIGLSSSILFGNGPFQTKKLNYNDTPRCCLGGKEQVINRFCQVESRWGYSGTSDRVRFSVNRRIFVVGFGLYGSIYGKCEYQVIIQVRNIDYNCKFSRAFFMMENFSKSSYIMIHVRHVLKMRPHLPVMAQILRFVCYLKSQSK